MQSFLYFIIEQYPWWGIPLALILVEVAMHFRRSGQGLRAMGLLCVSAILIGLAVYFILENGVQNVRPAMRKIEQKYFE